MRTPRTGQSTSIPVRSSMVVVVVVKLLLVDVVKVCVDEVDVALLLVELDLVILLEV